MAKQAERTPELKQVIDLKIAKALSHSYRSHTLATLSERIASPKEVAEETGIPVEEISYHFRDLREKGLIRLVRTEQRRFGAKEHFYEPTKLILYIDDREWARMPKQIRSSISGSFLKNFFSEAFAALRAGTFDGPENHQSRATMVVDERGWRELMRALEEALERVLEIRTESARRLQATTEPGTRVSVMMAGFEQAPKPARREA